MKDIREAERDSIRDFVQQAANDHYFGQSVLDYGCGQQPYRQIVEDAGAHYDGYDEADFPANISLVDMGTDLFDGDDPVFWDALLCNQVIQYVPDPLAFLKGIKTWIRPDGYLVMTGPTNWPIVQTTDMWRFTPDGIRQLLLQADYVEIVRLERRGEFAFGNDSRWILGWGVIARA